MSPTAPPSSLTDVPPLPTATLELGYRARGRVHLPSPPAHVWRGQLGYYLHRLADEESHAQDLSLYRARGRARAAPVRGSTGHPRGARH